MLQKESLRNAIDDYIVNYSLEAGLVEKTVRNKREIINRFFVFLNGKPYSVSNVRAFIAHLSQNGWKEANSRANLVKVFRAFTNFLYKRKYIAENFAQELIKPKIPRKPFDYVPPETVEKIIEAGTVIGDGDRARSKRIKAETALALRFILRTGIRINELLEMRGFDLNICGAPPTFYVNSKGGDRDLLPLPKDMLKILEKRTEQPRVFVVTKETCNDVLQRGAKKLGLKIKITNHILRHIFATTMVKNKMNPQYLQQLMRHSSLETTNKFYTHLDMDDLSLALNSTQTVVREGLEKSQVFDMVEQAVKSIKIDRDERFLLNVKRDKNGIHLHVLANR